MSAPLRLTPNLPQLATVGPAGATQEIPPDVVEQRDKPRALPSLLPGGRDLPATAFVTAVEFLGEAMEAWYLYRQHMDKSPCTSCPPPPPLDAPVIAGWYLPVPKCEGVQRALRHLSRLGIPPPKSPDQAPEDSYHLALAMRTRRELDHELALTGALT